MFFYDILKKLLFSSKTVAEDLDSDELALFQPYLINRWISFYSKVQTIFVNETLNKFTGLFEDKGEMYKLYYNLIPTQSARRITYIKKKKEVEIPVQEDFNIPVLARNKMISQREVKMYLDFIDSMPN